MSTFFGILQTGQGILDTNAYPCMESVMYHWRTDRAGSFKDHNISMGNLLLRVSPQSVNEFLPLTVGSFTIAGDIRLDNREDLMLRLGDQFLSDLDMPDGMLLLELYRREGKKMLRHLIGDFAFSIWNAEDRTLFCARDHLGVRPFYYYHLNDLFIFSSEKNGILSIPGINAEVNETYALLILADLDTPRGETFFKHIRQLPAAHSLCIGPDGLITEKYWQLELPPLLKLKQNEDYYQGFRSVFQQAVDARINTKYPVGVELSGGLDSGGILGMASRSIEDKGMLHTFSNVAPLNHLGQKIVADEEHWIDQLIDSNKVTNAHKLRSGGWKYALEPHDLELSVHGSPMSYCSSWMEPVRRSMEAYGVRVVLSGFGGDEFVTNQASNYFYDIFYEKDFAEFVRVCLKKGIPFMPAKMIFRDVWGRLGFNPFPRDMKQSATRYSLLLDKILDQRLEQTFPSSSTWSPPDRSHKKMIMNLISRPWLSYRLEAEAGFATSHGLINCYPLLDIRVLQYFLSLPARIIGEPGKTRTFFRQAMTGLIPDSVRLREDKSFPASPFSRLDVDERSVGYLTWLKEIEDLSQIGLVSKIDYAELLRRLDIGKKVNDAQGTMQQTVKFSTLSMIRFFHKTQNIIE